MGYKFIIPEMDSSEASSREGLHVKVNKSPDRKIGYYTAVYNKYGYQVSNTEYAFRKKELTSLTVDYFKID